MGANAAVYLPHKDIDLVGLFELVTAGTDDSDRTIYFDVELNSERVRFNIMPQEELSIHLQGFANYVDTLDEPDECKADARMLIEHTVTVLGLAADSEFEDNPAIWQSLFQLADRWDGFIFTYDSILLPNGGVIIGPLKQST